MLIIGEEFDSGVQITGNEHENPMLFLAICMACLALYEDSDFICSELDEKDHSVNGAEMEEARSFCAYCSNCNLRPGSAERITALGSRPSYRDWRCPIFDQNLPFQLLLSALRLTAQVLAPRPLTSTAHLHPGCTARSRLIELRQKAQ